MEQRASLPAAAASRSSTRGASAPATPATTMPAGGAAGAAVGSEKGSLIAQAAAARQRKIDEQRLRMRSAGERRAAEEAARQRDWAEWSETFFTCNPTRMALEAGVTSTAARQQTTWINANERIERAKESKGRVVAVTGDPLVMRVVALQTERGEWGPSPELTEALGGFLPDAPEGVVPWRWMTCLALAFLRRRPDQVRKEACSCGCFHGSLAPEGVTIA